MRAPTYAMPAQPNARKTKVALPLCSNVQRRVGSVHKVVGKWQAFKNPMSGGGQGRRKVDAKRASGAIVAMPAIVFKNTLNFYSTSIAKPAQCTLFLYSAYRTGP